MRVVTLVILNSLRIKCHIRRPLKIMSMLEKASFMYIVPLHIAVFRVGQFEGVHILT